MGDSRSHVHRSTQRRVRRIIILIAITLVVVLTPLIVNGQWRLDVAWKLGLAPGGDVHQIADPKDGYVLVVIPFRLPDDPYQSAYRNRAQYLAKESSEGTSLQDLSSEESISIPLTSLDFIAASEDGSTVFIRQGQTPSEYRSVLIDVASGKVTSLPDGSSAPRSPGDWTTPVWEKDAGRCGPRSVTGIYVACLPRAPLASYLAGDWQLNLQVYGDYRKSQEIFRGLGFLPTIGWNADDTVVYFANERGIWRADVNPDGFSG